MVLGQVYHQTRPQGFAKTVGQGERILISDLAQPDEYLEQVILPPAGQQAFAPNASFAGFLLFEQVERDVAQDREIFRARVFAHPTVILIKGNIQRPMQFVLNAPV